MTTYGAVGHQWCTKFTSWFAPPQKKQGAETIIHMPSESLDLHRNIKMSSTALLSENSSRDLLRERLRLTADRRRFPQRSQTPCPLQTHNEWFDQGWIVLNVAVLQVLRFTGSKMVNATHANEVNTWCLHMFTIFSHTKIYQPIAVNWGISLFAKVQGIIPLPS